METPANIDNWIQAASANLNISAADRVKASNLYRDFQRLDWWSDYSDDGDVRYREMNRTGDALDRLKEFAGASKDHAYLASRIYDQTAPEEFMKPRPWYVPAELMTIEAVERDPWNAVRLELPANFSADLAKLVVNTVFDLRNDALHDDQEAEARGDTRMAKWIFNRGDEAEQRRKDALLAHGMAKAREAWQVPAFSRETIEADPWTAVYLPIPDKADVILLTEAYNWTRDLVRYAEGDGAFSQPLVDPERHNRVEHIAAATARTAELEQRVKTQLLHQIKVNNPEFSRWTGEPVDEAAGQAQSAGKGQSHR